MRRVVVELVDPINPSVVSNDPLRTLTHTIRANTICCIAELATNFPYQNFPLPRGAVAFGTFTGATIGMTFGGIITHPNSHVSVEGTYRRGTGGLQRVLDGRGEIIGAATGHKSLLCLP